MNSEDQIPRHEKPTLEGTPDEHSGYTAVGDTNHIQRDSNDRNVRYTSLAEFLQQSGGNRIIRTLLIANNGIAAVKCMRSLRKWTYAMFHDEDALKFVCMATPEDVNANAEYIKMANKTVMVPGGSNLNNYANVELILQTAVDNNVDAVWAGWGHASENPQLPDALSKNNIAFLGPSHYAMWSLGDKIASTILAQSANVPTLPWSGSDLRFSLAAFTRPSGNRKFRTAGINGTSDDTVASASGNCLSAANSTRVPSTPHLRLDQSNDSRGSLSSVKRLPEELYRRACVTDVASSQACAERIGFPVMIKAAEGGGGKGIRKVMNTDEVARFFPQVQSEVPGSPIFLMKCAQKVRHLEIQLLADQYGQAISLYGRDCSVQRRHQKIIEEAPIFVAPRDTVEAMERAAIRLAKLVGYVGAGTVEYLYDQGTNKFYFLELNPRLQVEHPCTEVIAEVNLPACQLQIAMGIPLHHIRDVRLLYRMPATMNGPIDFDQSVELRRPPSGYVIAARITSEDPDEGFKPQPGDVKELNFKSSQSVWGYFSVGSAGGIHEFADSQFGHCFSAAENRDQARENLVLALKELSIRGDFRTTVEYLIKIMESKAFMNHQIDTDWLDKRIAQKDQVEKPDLLLGVVCTALHIADRTLRHFTRNYELHLERGHFLPSNTLTNWVDVTLVADRTKFPIKVYRTGPSSFHLISNASLLAVEAHRMSSDGLLVCHELASYMTYCYEDIQGYRTVINNRSVTFSKETDLSVLRSQSTGKLLQFTVTDGSHVEANEVYALIEVMKLILELRLPTAGKITLKRLPGSTLEPGTELARLQLDDSTQLKSLVMYNGPLLLYGTSNERRGTVHGSSLSYYGQLNATNSTDDRKDRRRMSIDSLPLEHLRNVASASFIQADGGRTQTPINLDESNSTNSDGNTSFDATYASFSSTTSNLIVGHDRSTASLLAMQDGKLHHNFARLLASFEQLLLGYALPEPFLSPWINDGLDRLMRYLHDPRLPLLELQDTVAQLAGRLPPIVERDLRAQAKVYAGQVTSVLANFPSREIMRIVQNHLTRLRRRTAILVPNRNPAVPTTTNCPTVVDDPEVLRFQQTVQRLIDLAERYKHGLRGHAIHTLSQLILSYVVVEKHFQYGQYDKCTRQLLSRCRSTSVWALDSCPLNRSNDSLDVLIDDELDCLTELIRVGHDQVSGVFQNLIQPQSISDMVAVLFSHRQLSAKNELLVRLVDLLRERRELNMACDLKHALKAIAELGAAGNAKVALSARQLLISIQTPSYELRRNQAESIFLSAVDLYGHQFHPENLRKLITSETVVFDILTDFFYYPNPAVASAALEVYVRRAYTAYELTSVQHMLLSNGASFVPFRFTLPTTQCLSSRSEPTVPVSILSEDADDVADDEISYERDRGVPIVTFQSGSDYTASPPPIPTRLSSQNSSNMQTVSVMGERKGGMAAFDTLEEFEESFDEMLDLFAEACRDDRTIQNSLSEPSLFNYGNAHFSDSTSLDATTEFEVYRSTAMVSFQDPPYQTTNPDEEPIHIMNIAIRHSLSWSDKCLPFESNTRPPSDSMYKRDSSQSVKSNQAGHTNTAGPDESDDVAQLEAFCDSHGDQLKCAGIRRITFLIVKTREFPKCYTFRARDGYKEDRVYRHLEPALAFQLELNRMRNYDLEQLPTLNRRMYLYLAKSKYPNGTNAVDYRFFVRCILRHADLLSREASFDFLQSEAERTLLEAMDALELALMHPDSGSTMGNHIFLNFAPIMVLEDMSRLKATIRRTVLRYARRFIRLRVTQAELKLRVRLQPSESPIPIRVTLNDEQGFNLGLDIYREVLDPSTDEVILWSLSSPQGSLHGMPALLPHANKDYLQLKRFQARKFNTTYVYDYPTLINQALNSLWSVYDTIKPPSDLIEVPLGKSSNSLIPSHSAQPPSIHTSRSADQPSLDATIPPGERSHSTRGTESWGSSLNSIISCTELALDGDGQLQPTVRTPGSNLIGMVAWHMVLRTPDSPTGRAIIVIANDATHMAGSFGPAEDLTFHRASHLARKLGIPRVYLASNTGARIRIAEEVKAVFRIAWLDPTRPDKGYDYLFLTPVDYESLHACEAVNCERIEVGDEVRYKIIDIVGKNYDMSVENLRGSAMIAGETSAAYDDIFTITIITNRSIGIGAYLARLGQRVVQVKNSHIILTGAMALNKLLGREVYTSNSQLGGVQVMANNGVAHLVAADELLALEHTLDWLTYVPIGRDQPVSVLHRPVPLDRMTNTPLIPLEAYTNGFVPFDPIDRRVEYAPSRDRTNDDPRWMFTGVMESQLEASTTVDQPPCPEKCTENLPLNASSDNRTGRSKSSKTSHWLSGFFDWGTWHETLASWAAGVVVGRARLGGIPCGAITSETRPVTCRVPADPANLSSEARVFNQAGQVWYPDSAYKTAQAIEDFARERLPLFIFASWRGFSGGMKDMYDQVLKFGSMIIDALRRYPEPVFVYLPPQSQLRGGAWVVVDPAINPDRMEMYADPTSCRAGVLEPEGTVEIKYRKADLIKTMRRLDERCQFLLSEIDRLKKSGFANDSQPTTDSNVSAKDLCFQYQSALEMRQKELHPFYHQVACTFADLHDTPGRLLSRGLVHGLVPWVDSRSFFYARLRRRLLELRAVKCIDSVCQSDDLPTEHDDHLIQYFSRQHQLPCQLLEALNRPTTNEDDLPAISETREELILDQIQTTCKNPDAMGSLEAADKVTMRHEQPRIRFTLAPLRVRLPECPPPSPIRPGSPSNCGNTPAGESTHNNLREQPASKVATEISAEKAIVERIAKFVPKLGVQYSPQLIRGLSYLRRWFIEEMDIPSMDSKIQTSHETPTLEKDSSVDNQSDRARLWNEAHLIVGSWLAQQLKCSSLLPVPDTDKLINPSSTSNAPVPPTESNSGMARTPIVGERRRSSVINHLDTLRCRAMMTKLRCFLTDGSDKLTEELSSVLTETLDQSQLSRLVQLLSKHSL